MQEKFKSCAGCSAEKPHTSFNKRKTASDGLRSRCRECENAENLQWRLANKKARTDYLKAYRARTKDHRSAVAKAWRAKNLDRALETGRAWKAANPHKNTAYASLRRARELQRTPGWLTPDDLEKMEFLYCAARAMTEDGGEPFHVDHILPLAGRKVSGLHVPGNLQILPGKENLQKNNRWSVE